MSNDDRTIEDRAYEALIAYVLRPRSEELTMDEVHRFMVEYDAGPRQGREAYYDPEGGHVFFNELPDYLNDLNAMHSAVASQPPQFRGEFQDQLDNMALTRHCLVCDLTAEDWAFSFLAILTRSVELEDSPIKQDERPSHREVP